MSEKFSPLPNRPKEPEKKEDAPLILSDSDELTPPPQKGYDQDSQDDEFVQAITRAKEMIELVNAENDQLKGQLENKDKEIEQLINGFEKIKTQLETINLKFEQNEIQIANLNETLKMKEDQIKLLQDTLAMKNDQIKIKEEQILNLKQSRDQKETELGALKLEIETKEPEVSVEMFASLELKVQDVQDENQKLNSELTTARMQISKMETEIKDKDGTISFQREEYQKLKKEFKEIQEEMKLTRLDLDAADEEIEKLLGQIEEQKSKAKLNIIKKFTEVEEIMKNILSDAQHKATLVVPMISDLQNLDLYSIKPTVQLSIATNFDPLKSEHSSLLEEYRSIENIQIKMYDLADRWGVFKDGEVVFLAINGAKSNECAIIESRDNLQIKTLSPLITDVWLRARKI